jgi:hypothetical protein
MASMMKRFLLIAALGTTLHASETAVAAKIIDKVVASMFHTDKSIQARGYTQQHNDIITHSKTMRLVSKIEDAKFYLVDLKIPDSIPENTILFSTDIEIFYNDERVIGAFYWQKGRPNLIFLRERLERYGVRLSDEFKDYIEDEL